MQFRPRLHCVSLSGFWASAQIFLPPKKLNVCVWMCSALLIGLRAPLDCTVAEQSDDLGISQLFMKTFPNQRQMSGSVVCFFGGEGGVKIMGIAENFSLKTFFSATSS